MDIEGALTDLSALARGDVVVLHGCCHNPTGADPAPEEWAALAQALGRAGALPLVDLAYLGFGDGLEADAAATRMLAAELPEALVAVSGSKSFGLYRDRAGLLLAVTGTAQTRAAAQSVLAHLNRVTCSFPPDHGARVVTEILSDPALEAAWREELEGMRVRITELRGALARALGRTTNSDRFAPLALHRGMFSRLPLGPGAVAALRERHGIYLVGDGRMNVAGLGEAQVTALAEAVAAEGI